MQRETRGGAIVWGWPGAPSAAAPNARHPRQAPSVRRLRRWLWRRWLGACVLIRGDAPRTEEEIALWSIK